MATNFVNGIEVGALGSEVTVADSSGNLYQAGTQITATAAELNAIAGTGLSAAELGFLDGATAGTQVASKAVIADANVNTGISKITELHIGTSGSETQVTSTAAELNYLDLTTGAGTQEASKAVVADANVNTGISKVTELHIGASGSETQVTATAAEINRAADASARAVSLTTTPISITEATHENKRILLNKADGITITLPAATGTGNKYEFYVGTSVTSNGYIIQVADASTVMDGMVLTADDTGTPVNGVWVTAADSDTVTLDGSTKGGIIGDKLEFVDIGSNQWAVHGILKQSGTEATPFSAAVS